jgi:hypothetical protein
MRSSFSSRRLSRCTLALAVLIAIAAPTANARQVTPRESTGATEGSVGKYDALNRPHATSRAYPDPAADSLGSPDITAVVVGIDAHRQLTLRVSIMNRADGLLGSDLLVVGLDVDRDKMTGGPLGVDYVLSATNTGANLGVWDCFSVTGCGYVSVAAGATASASGNWVSISTALDRLGLLADLRRPRFRFVVIAIANTDKAEDSWACDVTGPWIYPMMETRKSGRREVTRAARLAAVRR